MEEPKLSLFRPQALRAQRPQAYGSAILVRPLSFTVLTVAALVIGATIVGFFIWGSYTAHTTLEGQLVPARGLISVHTPQFGTIVEKHVSEGDTVARGDILYTISSERLSSLLGPTQRLVGRELEAQERSLERQIARTRRHEEAEREALERMEQALRREASNLEAMLESQQERLRLASDAVARHAQMHEEGFVSEEHLAAQRENHLEQRSRLQNLERERNAVQRQLTDVRNQTSTLPFQYERQLAELGRAAGATRRELTENEARRLVSVTAPASGIVTAVAAELGQIVDSTRPLLAIVPEGSKLEAHFYAPSHAVGFVRAGDRVLLRYAPYPYQRFGHYEGHVKVLSRAAVSPMDLLGQGALPGDFAGGEPVYRVRVALASQTVTAYGESHELKAGMKVEADVIQHTRPLYQWVLEPLYTLSGRIH